MEGRRQHGHQCWHRPPQHTGHGVAWRPEASRGVHGRQLHHHALLLHSGADLDPDGVDQAKRTADWPWGSRNQTPDGRGRGYHGAAAPTA